MRKTRSEGRRTQAREAFSAWVLLGMVGDRMGAEAACVKEGDPRPGKRPARKSEAP